MKKSKKETVQFNYLSKTSEEEIEIDTPMEETGDYSQTQLMLTQEKSNSQFINQLYDALTQTYKTQGNEFDIKEDIRNKLKEIGNKSDTVKLLLWSI